jgi:glc operon protein GlcG
MVFSAKKLAYSSCFILFALSTAGDLRAADPTVAVKVISEAGAKQAIESAEQAAEKLHAPCAIAVVDRSGILIASLKMDGVRDGSPDLAIGKARTSALLQRPSAETETNINEGWTAFVTSGFMALRGGVPLMAGKEVVGAIGIAGLNKDTDVAIAQSAAAAFAATTGNRE